MIYNDVVDRQCITDSNGQEVRGHIAWAPWQRCMPGCVHGSRCPPRSRGTLTRWAQVAACDAPRCRPLPPPRRCAPTRPTAG